MSAFVCQECYRQSMLKGTEGPGVLKHPSDRFKVSLDVMSNNDQTRVSRTHLADLCRTHAEAMVAKVRANGIQVK